MLDVSLGKVDLRDIKNDVLMTMDLMQLKTVTMSGQEIQHNGEPERSPLEGSVKKDYSSVSRRTSSITNQSHEQLLRWSTKIITFLNNLTMEQTSGKTKKKAAMPYSAFAKPKALAFFFRRSYGFLLAGGQTEIGFITKKINDQESGEARWSAPYFMKGYGLSIGFTLGKLQSGLCLALMNDEALEHSLQSNIKFGSKFRFLIDMDGAYIRPVMLDSTAMEDNVIQDGNGGLIAKYFRMQAMLAELTLDWSRVVPDKFLNKSVYGSELTGEEILGGDVTPPTEFSGVIDLLNRLSMYGDKKSVQKKARVDQKRKPSPFN